MSIQLLLATLGAERRNVPDVIERALAMSSGFEAHAADYPGLSPSLPVFQGLLQGVIAAQERVPSRTVGLAAARDVERDLLWSAMKSERAYVQSLVDAAPTHGRVLIVNAGLLVGASNRYAKPLLTLTQGAQPGTVACDANLVLLAQAAAIRPYQKRCLEWEYTLDGAETFVSAGSTPGCKILLTGLPSLRVVGVRVCLNGMRGLGVWSQVETIVVH
jgi:hypothetical protein